MRIKKRIILKTACAVYIVFWLVVFSFTSIGKKNGTLSFLEILSSYININKPNNGFFSYPVNGKNLSKGQPVKSLYIKREMEDKRAAALTIFLRNYNSPMADYAEVFVAEADRYGFDWRLSPAITMVETGGGRVTPPNQAGEITYNAWGWREGGDWKKFAGWDDGIRYVAHRFANGYGLAGLNPNAMEPIYCPPCHEGSPGRWAEGVIKYMNQIQSIYNSL